MAAPALRSLVRPVVGTAAVTAAAGAAAAVYGGIERNRFEVRAETAEVLPPGQRPMRILHLSDIHMVPGQKAKAEWLKSLAGLRPDLVVNTGDNLSHPKAVPAVLEALKPLLDYPGVFVPGSNDYFAPILANPLSYLAGPSSAPGKGRRRALRRRELPWRELHAGFGIGGWVDLTNRHQSLVHEGMRLDFSGVDDPHLGRDRYTGWPNGSSSAHLAPHVKIGVLHAPYQRVLDTFTAGGADLLLAGHTHGGQVCIPGYGALVSNCDLPTWRARGLTMWEYDETEVPLNVSAGIGTSRFAPIRIACRPEAVLLTLTARKS